MDNKFLKEREIFHPAEDESEPILLSEPKKQFTIRKGILIFGVVLAVYFGTIIVSNYYNMNQLADEKVRVEVELQKMDKEIKELERIIKNAQNPEFIEKMARENLKMVKPDESVYIVVK